MGNALESLKEAPHAATRTQSTENWHFEGMETNYHPGLGLMEVQKCIPSDAVYTFIEDMLARETYYGSLVSPNDDDFVEKVMSKRANEHNPRVYFRDQEDVYGKIQLDLQGGAPGLRFSDVLPKAMAGKKNPGENLYSIFFLLNKLCLTYIIIIIIIIFFFF